MTTPGATSPDAGETDSPSRRSGFLGLPLLLLILAIGDLRVDLRLLLDHFTITSLTQAIVSHPLAVTVLVAQPSLWRRYRGPRRNRS